MVALVLNHSDVGGDKDASIAFVADASNGVQTKAPVPNGRFSTEALLKGMFNCLVIRQGILTGSPKEGVDFVCDPDTQIAGCNFQFV